MVPPLLLIPSPRPAGGWNPLPGGAAGWRRRWVYAPLALLLALGALAQICMSVRQYRQYYEASSRSDWQYHTAHPSPAATATIKAALPGLTPEEYEQAVRDLVPGVVRPNVPPSQYLSLDSILPALQDTHLSIRTHVSSPAYQDRLQHIRRTNTTGIIIPAGGAQLTMNLLVTLQVLRRFFKCSLPIEVMWQGPQEMDPVTWGNIEERFAPIRGVDISLTPHPVPGLHTKPISLKRYTGKVYSLLVSEFRHVLMIDADSMPTQDPRVFFQHPQYKASGNLFWPACWTGRVKADAYRMFGLKPGRAQEVLFQGKGFSPRDTESGQLLLDRAQHLDVLEYLLWMNSDPSLLVGLAWGDKDTFGMAFAAAGKAHLYSQVPVPPAAILGWTKDKLLVKASGAVQWGWQLLGVLQHDSWGAAAFIHRTIDKHSPKKEPRAMEVITAPMPSRWAEYFIAQESRGPTKGVPWDYVAPGSALTVMTTQPGSPQAQWVAFESNGTFTVERGFPGPGAAAPLPASAAAACPDPPAFLRLWAMKESGLPVDLSRQPVEQCMRVLEHVLGAEVFGQYRDKGWLLAPSMRYLDGRHMTNLPRDWEVKEAALPLPAWRPDFKLTLDNSSAGANADAGAETRPFEGVVRAAHLANAWARANTGLFPILLT